MVGKGVRVIVNIHERTFGMPVSEVAELLGTLASQDDRVWPHESWPRMRFDQGLVTGASGGHGPVRYRVERADPAAEVAFAFTGPSGFDGGHAFIVTALGASATAVRHEIRMRIRGWARLTWPLFFRPLHNALVEEALDKLGSELGEPPVLPHRRSAWVRALRAAARLRR